MNISAWAIRNPIISIFLFIFLLFGGFLGFSKLKIQHLPDIDFPVVLVSTAIKGASAAQLEDEVAKILESKLSNVKDLRQINSIINQDSVIFVLEFQFDTDVNQALIDVRNQLDQLRNQLPVNASFPAVSKLSTTGLPIASYVVSSSNLDQAKLSFFVDQVIIKKIASLNGVDKVERIGGKNRKIIIELNPAKMHEFGLAIDSVVNQLNINQQNLSAGRLFINNKPLAIRVVGQQDSLAKLSDFLLRNIRGELVPLKQIADIKDVSIDSGELALVDGVDVIGFDVFRSKGADEIKLGLLVDKALDDIGKQYPQNKITKIIDRVAFVKQDYEASIKMLIEGALLAVVVVFLFLRNLRATIISAISLPLSVIPSFWFINQLGFSLNALSLLALSLVIGLLVDDAIVEVENIVRHLQNKKTTPKIAAEKATNEIGLAVIATTATLVAVFLPTAFMDGIVGNFFKQFGWTASIAILMSLLVARLITPVLAAYFLKPIENHNPKESFLMKKYLIFVDWAVTNRWVTIAFAGILLFVSLFLAKLLPTNFIPNDDKSQIQVSIELPFDSSINQTKQIIEQARNQIKSIDGVELIYSTIGKSPASLAPSFNNNANQGILYIELKPRNHRQSKTIIEQQIQQRLSNLTGAKIKVGTTQSGSSGYELALSSQNMDLLTNTAKKLINQINDIPQVAVVAGNLPIWRDEVRIFPNWEKIQLAGISTASLARAIQLATIGDYENHLTKINIDDQQLPIVVHLQGEPSLTNLQNLLISSSSGLVKLGDLVKIELAKTPINITRLNQMRAVNIKVDAKSGVSNGEIAKLINDLPVMKQLPDGVFSKIKGDTEQMQELISNFIIVMVVGVLCIYMVLVILFKKFLQPLTILVALPLSIGGAVVGLLLNDLEWSMPSMIGIIMLMGVSTKNSILLVDYALIAQYQMGMSKRDALLDACKKRSRPILMTTIAMGAGMLPLIFGWGVEDISFRKPMAIAVFGGLITSTLLSLAIIPAFYSVMDSFGCLFAKKKYE